MDCSRYYARGAGMKSPFQSVRLVVTSLPTPSYLTHSYSIAIECFISQPLRGPLSPLRFPHLSRHPSMASPKRNRIRSTLARTESPAFEGSSLKRQIFAKMGAPCQCRYPKVCPTFVLVQYMSYKCPSYD